jgi:ribulose-bisphosphate carboxylase small chain
MFDLKDPAGIMMELKDCRANQGDKYIKVVAFDSHKGFESLRMSFLVNRPKNEPGFELVRSEAAGRKVNYALRSYATGKPAAARYG